MKRFIIVSLLLCLVAPLTVKAEKKSFGNGLFWEITGDGTLIISGNGNMPDYEHPWKDNNTIKKLIIENGILSIGQGCFSNMSSLSIVFIANTVTSIVRFAFDDDDNLSKVNLPNSLKVIGEMPSRAV